MSDNPNGDWSLLIDDTVINGASGSLVNWSLDIVTKRP